MVKNRQHRGSWRKMQNLQLYMLCSHIIQTLIKGVECDFAVNGVHWLSEVVIVDNSHGGFEDEYRKYIESWGCKIWYVYLQI
jgi:hypothetical protein